MTALNCHSRHIHTHKHTFTVIFSHKQNQDRLKFVSFPAKAIHKTKIYIISPPMITLFFILEQEIVSSGTSALRTDGNEKHVKKTHVIYERRVPRSTAF